MLLVTIPGIVVADLGKDAPVVGDVLGDGLPGAVASPGVEPMPLGSARAGYITLECYLRPGLDK
jgi:hypothetical protein